MEDKLRKLLEDFRFYNSSDNTYRNKFSSSTIDVLMKDLVPFIKEEKKEERFKVLRGYN